MSFKSQIIEWDVPIEDVQVGIPVGYAADLSLNPSFKPVLYSLTTYQEGHIAIDGTFLYSLDDGVTWIEYPRGEDGLAFTTAYKMRLIIDSANVGDIFVEKNGTVYRVRPDAYGELENYQIGEFTSNGFDIDGSVCNSLYVSSEDQKTLFLVDTTSNLEAGDNSLNLHNDPLGIAVDGSRDLLWHVARSSVLLKDLDDGGLIMTFNIGEDISPEEFSSSSSFGFSSSSESFLNTSSSSSSVSSSSAGYSTSSSSSAPLPDPVTYSLTQLFGYMDGSKDGCYRRYQDTPGDRPEWLVGVQALSVPSILIVTGLITVDDDLGVRINNNNVTDGFIIEKEQHLVDPVLGTATCNFPHTLSIGKVLRVVVPADATVWLQCFNNHGGPVECYGRITFYPLGDV